MVAKVAYTDVSGWRALCFLTCFIGGIAALMLGLHLQRAHSFALHQVQFVESHWAEKTVTYRGRQRRVTVLSVTLMDRGRQLTEEVSDLTRAYVFLRTNRPGDAVPFWVSVDGSQLHPPEVADLSPYSLLLFVAAIPIAALSALLTFSLGRFKRVRA